MNKLMKFIACLQITCWQKALYLSVEITHCQFFQWLNSKLQIPQWWFLEKISYCRWFTDTPAFNLVIDVMNYLLTLLFASFAKCILPVQCRHRCFWPMQENNSLYPSPQSWCSPAEEDDRSDSWRKRPAHWEILFPPRERQGWTARCFCRYIHSHEIWRVTHMDSDLTESRVRDYDYTFLSLGFRPRF